MHIFEKLFKLKPESVLTTWRTPKVVRQDLPTRSNVSICKSSGLLQLTRALEYYNVFICQQQDNYKPLLSKQVIHFMLNACIIHVCNICMHRILSCLVRITTYMHLFMHFIRIIPICISICILSCYKHALPMYFNSIINICIIRFIHNASLYAFQLILFYSHSYYQLWALLSCAHCSITDDNSQHI